MPTETQLPMRPRLEYIDIAKGIGILLVVMGHNDLSLLSPFLFKLVYSFHMPLFFFLSGMFFNPATPFLTFVRRRFDSTLKPYIFTVLLIYFATISFSKIDFASATSRVIKAMYANGHYLDWAQLWFLPHLFVVSLFAFVFFKTVYRIGQPWLRWVLLVFMQVIGVLGLSIFWPFQLNLLGKELTLFGLPFSLDLVLVSGFFFILGYEANNRLPVSFFEKSRTLIISGLALVTLIWFLPSAVNLNERQFDSLIVNTTEALLGIIFVLSLSKQIEQVSQLSALFQYLGQTSLIILLFQVPIQAYWSEKVFAVTNNFPLSYWIAFLAGVIGPIVINVLFIRPNPVLSRWFGHKPQNIELLSIPK